MSPPSSSAVTWRSPATRPPRSGRANPTTTNSFFSNLVLECWELDRDDSNDDVQINRAFGILSASSPSSSLIKNVPSSSKSNSAVAREYSDLKVIGSGSFGTIYSAKEVGSGQRVAIKVESRLK